MAHRNDDSGQVRRVMGGFRRWRSGELGDEQLCPGCGEFWPVDAEFFSMSARHLSYVCRACQAEQRAGRAQKTSAARTKRDAAGTVVEPCTRPL